MKNQSGPIAKPITIPKIMKTMNIDRINRNDFNLFLDIWSWKDILSDMV